MRIGDKNIQSANEIAIIMSDLVQSIEETKSSLDSVLNQDELTAFFSKGSNIKVLAENLIKQNETISSFLNITQTLMGWSMTNTVFIADVIQKLNEHSQARGDDHSSYISMAKSYLQEGLNAANKTNERIKKNSDKLTSLSFQIPILTEKLDRQTISFKESLSAIENIKNISIQQGIKIKNIELDLNKSKKNYEETNTNIRSLINSSSQNNEKLAGITNRLNSLEINSPKHEFQKKIQRMQRLQIYGIIILFALVLFVFITH